MNHIYTHFIKDWSSTRISCSAVLKAASAIRQFGPSLLESHTFLNIDVDNTLLPKRENTHSILIGTILAFLCDQIPAERGVFKDLANVIRGAGPPQELITVATTHVSSFGDDIQNPVYGY